MKRGADRADFSLDRDWIGPPLFRLPRGLHGPPSRGKAVIIMITVKLCGVERGKYRTVHNEVSPPQIS